MALDPSLNSMKISLRQASEDPKFNMQGDRFADLALVDKRAESEANLAKDDPNSDRYAQDWSCKNLGWYICMVVDPICRILSLCFSTCFCCKGV